MWSHAQAIHKSENPRRRSPELAVKEIRMKKGRVCPACPPALGQFCSGWGRVRSLRGASYRPSPLSAHIRGGQTEVCLCSVVVCFILNSPCRPGWRLLLSPKFFLSTEPPHQLVLFCFRVLFLIMCMGWGLCKWVQCLQEPEASDSLELEWQVLRSCPTWVLRAAHGWNPNN